ncbi:MAG: hypothetical protein GF311_28595 [Candidatus Lokiarchaeota archaeon]|nr:hypothetical protein [Candidatus Lokiarchaeota archaeon]
MKRTRTIFLTQIITILLFCNNPNSVNENNNIPVAEMASVHDIMNENSSFVVREHLSGNVKKFDLFYIDKQIKITSVRIYVMDTILREIDVNGLITKQIQPNVGTWEYTYTYNADEKFTNRVKKYTSGSSGNISFDTLVYEYDSNGNVKRKIQTGTDYLYTYLGSNDTIIQYKISETSYDTVEIGYYNSNGIPIFYNASTKEVEYYEDGKIKSIEYKRDGKKDTYIYSGNQLMQMTHNYWDIRTDYEYVEVDETGNFAKAIEYIISTADGDTLQATEIIRDFEYF